MYLSEFKKLLVVVQKPRPLPTPLLTTRAVIEDVGLNSVKDPDNDAPTPFLVLMVIFGTS